MVNRFKVNILFLFLVLSGFGVAQNQITVKAYTDSLDYLVGDRIAYTIEVTKESGITVIPPVIQDSLKGVEFIDKPAAIELKGGDKIIEKHIYYLMGFDSTEVEIPSFPVEYYKDDPSVKNTIYTDPVLFVVRTIEVDPQGDIQDVKSPITIALDLTTILIVVGIILLVILIIVGIILYIRKKRRGTISTVKKIVIPPHTQALKLLSALEEKKLWQQGKIKEYHTEITFIIRDYLEKRFKIPAMEVPSSELLMLLVNKAEFNPIYDKLRDFFSNADMVKFAKFEPMPSVNDEMLKQAYDVVNETKPSELTPEGNDVH